jgi:ketosteroid isomerase-like protein
MRLLAAALALPLLALLPATPAAAQGAEAEGAALMQADRDFARAAAARGLEGWMSYFTDDAVRLRWRDPAVRGLEAIREFDAALFADSAATLTWEPVEAGLYRGGELGWTRGRSEFRSRAADGTTVVQRGSYLTIWRKEPSGEWKVILDTGTSDPPA